MTSRPNPARILRALAELVNCAEYSGGSYCQDIGDCWTTVRYNVARGAFEIKDVDGEFGAELTRDAAVAAIVAIDAE